MVEEFKSEPIEQNEFFVYVNQVCTKTVCSLLDCANCCE